MNVFAHPGLVLIIGSILLFAMSPKLRSFWSVLLCGVGAVTLSKLSVGTTIKFAFLGMALTPIKVDALSLTFATVFIVAAIASMIYGFEEKSAFQKFSAFFYIGSSIGVTLAGDWFTLYMFWEAMAVFSTFLILGSRTKASYNASLRYILVHVTGGLLLLGGIILTVANTGSLTIQSLTVESCATWMILAGFLVNVAAVPFSSWVKDAYPKATLFGGVVLSAFTTKAAVYALIRVFSGWDILIPVGCLMAVYGVVYAVFAQDIRKLLAYSIVNQLGYMVVAVGVGSKLALSGAAAHAFVCVIYLGLLWMVAGAVIKQTGKHTFSELGGLAKSMPLTALFAVIGAAAIAVFPLTSTFTTKTMILIATEKAHLFWPWIILEGMAAAVVLHAGFKFPYAIFFGKAKKTNEKVSEAPIHMLTAMALFAGLTIYIGISPESLYTLLPNTSTILKYMPATFSDIYLHHVTHVATQLQLLAFAVLGYFLLQKHLPTPNKKAPLEFDAIYSAVARIFYWLMDILLNSINKVTDQTITKNGMDSLAKWAKHAPAHVISSMCLPVWVTQGYRVTEIKHYKKEIAKRLSNNSSPIGYGGVLVLVLAILLIYI